MKPIIVISCERFFTPGGAITMVSDCLRYLSGYVSDKYQIKVLVYQKKLYPQLRGIDYVEFPKARKSFLLRLYYEYVYFKRLSEKWKPILWFSMQDSTPNVKSNKAVYIHNSFIAEPLKFDYLIKQPRFFALHLLYRFVYSKNIQSNKFIIVQQQALANRLIDLYKIDSKKLIIARPTISENITVDTKQSNPNEIIFLYPASDFVFKNYEVIVSAAQILKKNGIDHFKIIFTITGEENSYTKSIKKKAENCNIVFMGFLSKDELYKLYANCNALLFSSLSESWGLPLSEFQHFNKPIIATNLPYAKETIGDYEKAIFFPATDDEKLATLMKDAIDGHFIYHNNILSNEHTLISTNNWKEVFDKLLLNLK